MWVALSSTMGTLGGLYYLVRRRSQGAIETFCAVNIAFGNLIFAVCSFTFLKPSLTMVSLVGFLIGSFNYLFAGLGFAAKNQSFLHPKSAVYPFRKAFVPNTALFTLAAVIYILGTVAFIVEYDTTGSAIYLIGSCVMLLISWCDIVVWVEGLCTKTE